MLALDTMLDDFTAKVETSVEERHGLPGTEVWREDPATFDEFVTSHTHLNLPPLYPRQLEATVALIGTDPKRMFEEPHRPEPIPLAWAKKRSSNVRAIGWHDDRLYVHFKSGGVYAYAGVRRPLFEAVLEAKSVGRAINALKARFESEQLPDPDVMIAADWEGRVYQMAVLLWGKGSGKDYLSSIIVSYIVYVLLCLRDPQGYLGLAPGENVDVVNVAYNADQAKKVFFTKLKARIKRWKWLTDNYNVFESGKRIGAHQPGRPEVQINDDFIEFPRVIRCHSRHAQNESYEGLNIIAWVMDEASAFLSPAKRENAESIFGTLRTSANTRFQRRWIGLVISYPRHADDFTMTQHAKAVKDPTLGMYPSGPYKTWEVNEAVGRGEWVEVRPGHRVPIELAPDYEILGFEEAQARFECNPPAAVDALIKFPDRLWQSVKKGKKSLIEWEPIVTRREVGGPDGQTRMREFVGVKVHSWGKRLPRGTRMFFHGDPALTTDAFALAFGHGVPATVMRHVPAAEVLTADQLAREGIEPTQIVQWEKDVVRTIIDALIVWEPDPRRNRQVDLLNVKDVLLDATKHHRIELGTFDNWGMFETVQELARRKVNVENEAWSNPKQLATYTNARSEFYNDLVTLPDEPTITSKDPSSPGALYELERVQLIEARKIDHPEQGSKDRADALVAVIKHVTELGRKGGISFGSAVGSREATPERQDYFPSTRRTEDPEKTPSPVRPHMRERDRQDRQARPLDHEVSPSDRPAVARPVRADEAATIIARAKGQEPKQPSKFVPGKR